MHILAISRYSHDKKKVSSRSRLVHSRVSSRSRLGQFGKRLGLGSSGLGLGLCLDPEGLGPIPVVYIYDLGFEGQPSRSSDSF